MKAVASDHTGPGSLNSGPRQPWGPAYGPTWLPSTASPRQGTQPTTPPKCRMWPVALDWAAQTTTPPTAEHSFQLHTAARYTGGHA